MSSDFVKKSNLNATFDADSDIKEKRSRFEKVIRDTFPNSYKDKSKFSKNGDLLSPKSYLDMIVKFHYYSHIFKGLILLTILSLIVLVLFKRQNNAKGWIAFTFIYTLNVTLFIPGIMLILGAGFVFGFKRGFAAVFIGGIIGQSSAFLLARYIIKDSLSQLVRSKWKKWDTVDKALEMEGFQLLILLRLSPIIPYNLINISMAATKIGFWTFASASLIGIIPECCLLCYMGSLATDLGQILNRGDAFSQKPAGLAYTRAHYMIWFLTVISAIVVMLYASYMIRRALTKAEGSLKVSGGDLECGDASPGLSKTSPLGSGRGAIRRHSQAVGEEIVVH